MSLFLLAPDLKRLINFFLLNKPTEAIIQPIYLKKRWLRLSALAIKCLFIGYLFYNGMINSLEGQKIYGDKKPKPPLYGLYDAELVIVNRDTIPPLTTDSNRWRNLVIQSEKNAMIKMMNDSVEYFGFIVDTINNSVSFNSHAYPSIKGNFEYKKKENYLILSGQIKRDSVYIRLKERDLKSFTLINRGFRWINEYPYNR